MLTMVPASLIDFGIDNTIDQAANQLEKITQKVGGNSEDEDYYGEV